MAKYLDVSKFYVTSDIEKFMHLTETVISWETITFEDLFLLKETMLHASNLKYLEIRSYGIEIDERVDATFWKPFEREGRDEVSWFFRIPNSQKILELIILEYVLLEFDIIQPGKVPENAVIIE